MSPVRLLPVFDKIAGTQISEYALILRLGLVTTYFSWQAESAVFPLVSWFHPLYLLQVLRIAAGKLKIAKLQ